MSAPSKIVSAFLARTRRSAELAEEARGIFPSGITHDGRFQTPYGVYIERALGSHKWDVDGNEYVDYTGGHGALLLGHSHPAIVNAITEQAARGTHFGSNHPAEIRWGQWVQKLIPSAERVRFTSSGTEATMMALRLARAFTGKPKIVRFKGHFHGWHDHMAFGVSSRFDGTPTPGVLAEIAGNVLLAPPGDIEGTEKVIAGRKDVAAVILEPTGASWGQVPLVPEFSHALRALTEKHGILLIFDEVISGFRCAPGGAQEVFGIRPDMTTLAKILAGGMPGGAVCGRAEILDQIAFDPPRTGEAQPASPSPPREKVPHQGTFNANPCSAAAGSAALEIVGTTDACDRANRFASELRDALNRVVVDAGLPWKVYGSFSGFHIFTNPDRLDVSSEDIQAGRIDPMALKARGNPVLLNKLRLGMLVNGVEIFSWIGGPTSAVHTADDLNRTVDAFSQTLSMLKQEGEV